MLALEPRFMYDAAGAATGAAVANAAEPAPVSHSTDHGGAETAAAEGGVTDTVPTPGVDQGRQADVSADVGPFGSKGEAQLESAARDAEIPISEIVFIDGRLPDAETLTVSAGVEVVVLDPARDGLSQITHALAGHQGDLTAIHFVSHGENGTFGIGATNVDSRTLAAHAAEIAQWGSALNADGDILIWGCDVAELPGGQALINSLAALTGADVAASTDATGGTGLGGDWDLETRTGAIDVDAPFEVAALAAWNHLLDTPTVTGAANAIIVSEPSTLNEAGASTTTLAGWDFSSSLTGDTFTVSAVVDDVSVGTLADAGGLGTAIAGGFSFTGSLADANAWLDQLTFTAADVERGSLSGTATLTLGITNDTDGANPNSQRDIRIEVAPSNDPVLVADSTLDVIEGSTGTVVSVSALPAVDPEVSQGSQDASQIVYRLTSSPVHGYLALSGTRLGVDSIFTQQDVINGNLVYVHDGGQQSADSFSVLANDGATPLAPVDLSDAATVTVNIVPVNQAPSVSGAGSVYEGQPANATLAGVPQSVVGSFIVADSGGDPVSTDNDTTLQVQLTSLAQHGLLFFTGTASLGGVSQSFTNHQITQADIDAGFVFAYADRTGLTYGNDGIDVDGRPPSDSFDVAVTDGGGGTGSPLTDTATIVLDIRALSDEPIWVDASTLTATVPEDYIVQLTPAMLSATDTDSPPESITFRVVDQSGLDQGGLVRTIGGVNTRLPDGATFTLADVNAGLVFYYQFSAAGLTDTDTFTFQVVDNSIAVHWEPTGEQFERPGGIYTGAGQAATLRNFDFIIHLRPSPASTGLGDGLPVLDTDTTGTTSGYAGTDQTGVTRALGEAHGVLIEGGSVVLTDGSGTSPGMNYSAAGVDPSQVVYTILAFNGGDFADWNGQLQKLFDGNWIALNAYDTFTQADLNSGAVRFVHDGGEDFSSSVKLSASAGVLQSDGMGGFEPDAWVTEFSFYVEPVNDAPTAVGSTDNSLDEGDTFYITTDQLSFADADDATSEDYLEGTATLPANGADNFADNNGSLLTFTITDQPDGGTLEYWDGDSWELVTNATVLEASWITGDADTTRLRYVHSGGEDATDSFQAQATDRWSAPSNTALVSFVITPVNDAPQIAADPTQPDPTGVLPGGDAGTGANRALIVNREGLYNQITSAMLQAIDPDSSATQVQYRITAAPTSGQIGYSEDGVNFTLISVGSSFTQADIEAGYIYYLYDGSDPTGTIPEDSFPFTLADGAAEQTGREFWILVQSSNDRPEVTAPAGPIESTDVEHSVPGFSVDDPDLETVTLGEVNFLEVTVRLLNEDGSAFSAADYAALGGVDIALTASGATIDADKDGQDDYLVLRGTREQLNAALATLTVTFVTDRDQVFQVQVIADDRVRDVATGDLVDRNIFNPGVDPGGNGGGTLNQPATPTDAPPVVVATEPDWYSDAVPTIATDPLYGSINADAVLIYASTDNDPATMASAGAADVFEDQPTLIGPDLSFAFSDPESEAFGTPVTITFTVPRGSLNVGTAPDGITVSGRNTGALAITGAVSAIQAFVNDGTTGLTYRSASNVNEDLNGAADGDVTLTVTFDDSGSNIGSGGTSNDPAPLEIALTITAVDDAPTVAAATGVVALTGATPVPGFSVGDIDITDSGGIATGETDFVEVTVRVTQLDGTALLSTAYDGTTGTINIGSTADVGALVLAGLVIDATYDGIGSALVLRGSLAQVNDYLAGITVLVSGDQANNDVQYRLEVIADDRVRGDDGVLAGTAANGGENDDSADGTSAVPVAPVLPYAAIPGGLTANVASASRIIFPTSVNDPADIGYTAPSVAEGSAILQLSGIVITDVDAIDRNLTVVVTLPTGFGATSVGIPLGGTAAISGAGNTVITLTGTLDQVNAAINTIVVGLPDEGGSPTSADWNGSFDVTIEVNDNGNTGTRPSSLSNVDPDDPGYLGTHTYEDPTGGGDPDDDNHLITTRTITFTVDEVNDAPQVTDGDTETLAATLEDTSPAGESVADLFASHFSDPLDPITGGSASNAFAGVAIVALTPDALQGVWQYFDGGTSAWVDIGARSASTALYLSSTTLIRFQAEPDFHGTPNTLTVRLVEDGGGGDASSVPANGAELDLSVTGGITRYSADTVVLSTSVTNVNDRPTIADAVLPATLEDAADPPGQTVSELFGDDFSDATDDQTANNGDDAATGLGGIAVVGNASDATTQGHWEYSTDSGSTWSQVSDTVSDTAALLLPTDALLRFVGNNDYNGTPGALSIRASDTAVAFDAAGDLTTALALGQTSQWSAVRSLGTTVSPVNDAPVLDGTPTDPTASENDETGTGTSIPAVALIADGALADIDLTTTAGLDADVFGAGRLVVSLGSTYLSGDVLSVAGTLPAGVTISGTDDGASGTLTILLDADTTVAEVEALIGQLRYSSTSDNPTNFGSNLTRTYTVSVLDGNNDQGGGDAGGDGTDSNSLASNELVGTITIDAENDPPTANDDAKTIAEDTASILGNVIDPSGPAGDVADTDPDTAVLTVVAVGVGSPSEAVSGATVVVGSYGTLTINTDGSYAYALDNTNADVNGLKDGETLEDVFDYRISDGALTDDATLTIGITGNTDGSPDVTPDDLNGAATGENTVFEDGLTSVADTSETATGTIVIDAPDGLASIAVGGTTVTLAELNALATTPVEITTAAGTLTLTGFAGTGGGGGVPTGGTLSYSYTLTVAQDTPGASENTDALALQVTDAGGDTADGTLTIRIVDDVPAGQNDVASIAEDSVPATVSGNVVSGAGAGDVADMMGGDGAAPSGPVTALEFDGTSQTVGSSFATEYGSIVVNADGSYIYTLDNSNAVVNALAAGEGLSEVVTYTITDADGDTSTATLTIAISGANDAPEVGPGPHVVSGREDAPVTFVPGDFAFTDPDATDTLQSVRIVVVPPVGGLYADGTLLGAGAVVSIADIAAGKLTYRGPVDGNGAPITRFSFQVGDGTAFSTTAEMSVNLDPRNDTPTVSGPSQVQAAEDETLAFDGGTGENHAPVISIDDAADRVGIGYTDAFTVTLSVSHGVLGIADPTGAISGEGSGTLLRLVGTREALNAALATLTYLADRNYSGSDRLTVIVNDHVNAGIGLGAESPIATHPVDIQVGPIGDSLILLAKPAEGIEDHWVPLDITVIPTDFSDIEAISVELSGIPAGWQVRVGDGPVRVSTGLGQVFSFSFREIVQGVSVLPSLDINTAPGQPYVLKVLAISRDGDSAAYTQGEILLTLEPENDRPSADGVVVLPATDNAQVSQVGYRISDLFPARYNDLTDDQTVSRGADADGPLAGIAIVGNASNASQGVWEFNLGDGSGWRAIPTSGLADGNALILPAADAMLRFSAAAGFTGTPGELTVWLSDGTGFPQAQAGRFADITAAQNGALGVQTGGWSRAAIPVVTTVDLPAINVLPTPVPMPVPLPVHRLWGPDGNSLGELPYIEGFISQRFTTASHIVSQQVIFRLTGAMSHANLFYEATLGRSSELPSWIFFDRSTLVVTADPPEDAEPGVYVVRVVARDASGNEAESSVAIHVLRDNTQNFETSDRKPPADPDPEPDTDLVAPDGETAPAPAEPAQRGDENSNGGPPANPSDGSSDREARLKSDGLVGPGIDAGDLERLVSMSRPVTQSGEESTGTARSSLSMSLLNSGQSGRMIEAARLLEALAGT